MYFVNPYQFPLSCSQEYRLWAVEGLAFASYRACITRSVGSRYRSWHWSEISSQIAFKSRTKELNLSFSFGNRVYLTAISNGFLTTFCWPKKYKPSPIAETCSWRKSAKELNACRTRWQMIFNRPAKAYGDEMQQRLSLHYDFTWSLSHSPIQILRIYSPVKVLSTLNELGCVWPKSGERNNGERTLDTEREIKCRNSSLNIEFKSSRWRAKGNSAKSR